MAFHQVRFPIDVSLGTRGGPQRMTDIVTLASGAEERNSRWADSRRKFDAGYGIKSLQQMRTVLAFFEERRGRFHSFLWRDALDHTTSATGGTPTATDEALGTGDGTTTQFQLTRTYGGVHDPWVRAITKPVAATVRVGMDGIEIPATDFSVDELTGFLSFNTAPGSGVVLTAGFEFDIPVRFDTDWLNVELSSFDAASVPSIPVIEVRE